MFIQGILMMLSVINLRHVDGACSEIRDALNDIQNKLDALTGSCSDRPNPVPYSSCSAVLEADSSAQSGEYTLTIDDKEVTVYCEMGTDGVCGGDGGWTRIAYYDIAAGDDCPSGLFTYGRDGKKLCDRNQDRSGGRCDSTFFSTHGISYGQVCGRVRGYQYDGSGYIDGIYDNFFGQNDLNGYYVDGVSITRGSPREHVWTFGNGHLETGTGSDSCPCNIGSSVSTPSYVGDSYYCESGTSSDRRYTFYPNDPLWDGEGCNSNESTCCTNPNLPYFVRDLAQSTENIELRICSSEGLTDEACGIDLIEIYIK